MRPVPRPSSGRAAAPSPSAAVSSATQLASRVRLLACGEPARGDDGVAPLAVERALARLPAAVRAQIEVRRRPGLDPADLVDLSAGTALLIVDAVVGVAPGSLVRRPLAEIPGAGGPAPASSHTLPIGDVLRIVEAASGQRPDGVFLGLGGHEFRLGAGLSGPVAEAVPRLEAAIVAEIRRLVRL